MMKNIMISLILGIFFPSILFSQLNNRIGLQTGLFHIAFDQSPIVNEKSLFMDDVSFFKRFKNPTNFFGGFLNDSHGILYERELNNKSSISIEFMKYGVVYPKKMFYSTAVVGPFIVAKKIKKINITYFRKLILLDKLKFVYGGGLNYMWGMEWVFLSKHWTGWAWEPNYYAINRNDFGFNLRTGIEYSPIKRITLYTNFDFLGIAYLGARGSDGEDAYDFFHQKYGIKYLPSRWDISWQFGIGYNFY